MLARPTLAALLLVPAAGQPDEAVRRDGTRVAGRLALTPAGRFTFSVAGRDEPVAGLDRVRFAPRPPAPPAVPVWHQVRLNHGEVLLGQVLKLDATHLHVRTAWAADLAVPRVAVERVTNAPGWRPTLFHPFEAGLDGWTMVGGPKAADGRLVLDRAGQAAEMALKEPVTAGRVGVGFREGRTTTRRSWLELGFVRDAKPAPVRVELVGPGDRYAVASPVKPRHDGRLRREAGPRRLAVEFDSDRLHVFVDDLVLWAQAEGPGELRSVRLAADGDGTEAAEVSDLAIARPEPVGEPQAWADLTADAVRSPDGDETFGSLSAAGPGGMTLEVKGQKRVVGWPAVAEFTFRRGPVTERATAGEHVRVKVASADGRSDVLDGAVKVLDDKALVLAHAVLGDLTIPRDRVEEFRPRFHGRRAPVDAAPRHLGDRPAFGFAVPKPDGLRFTKGLTVEAASGGFVVVDAAWVSGTGPVVEVRVNGGLVGELNRQADRAEAAVRAYRLPLPAVRSGEAQVEVWVRPPADGRRVAGVDLRAVRFELVDPR